MLSISDTGYPRLKAGYSPGQLERDYRPSEAELAWIRSSGKDKALGVALLTLLKTAQILGYFVQLKDVPLEILRFFARQLNYSGSLRDLAGYDASGRRARHLTLLRAQLEIRPQDDSGREVMRVAAREAALVREDVLDLVQRQLEELVRARYELPPFTRVLETALKVREEVNEEFYAAVVAVLTPLERDQLERLWSSEGEAQSTPWNALRSDPGKLSSKTVDSALTRFHWMNTELPYPQLEGVLPQSKREQFGEEARNLHAGQMKLLERNKILALGAILLVERRVRLHDDLAGMLVRGTSGLHTDARETHALEELRRLARAGVLVGTLKKVVLAYQEEGSDEDRYQGIHQTLEGRDEALLEACEAFELAGLEAYLPFLQKHFSSKRKMLLDVLGTLPIRWVVPGLLEKAMTFVVEWRTYNEKVLPVNGYWEARLSLEWVPRVWHRLLFGMEMDFSQYDESRVLNLNHRTLELCVLTQVMYDLRSGAAFIPGGRDYGDWRECLVSLEEYEAQLPGYLEQTGLPENLKALVADLKSQLFKKAQQFDAELERSESTGAEWRGEDIVLRSLDKRIAPEKLVWLEREITARIPHTDLLDKLTDTAHLVGWTRFFGLHSGASDRLGKPLERYLTTVFSFGCNVGASQTARAFTGVDRRDIAWIDAQHIGESKLERAITEVVNAYNRFTLPKFWGNGKSVVADGTKYSMYEENLLAEYHVRYGGYGGIGYYHVSDNYIALFSHFISCGVWEAVYILDGMLKQQSDLEPNVVHADTQGQSLPVYCLSYVLGIELMPRIRNWRELQLYRASSGQKLGKLGKLLSQTIDWKLIERHLPEILRLAISIRQGRVLPSTILKRLNSYSRQNPFYAAMCELGKVVRTLFLMRYLGDLEVRRQVLYTTNKVEQFNAFSKWVTFGGEGKILENHRDRQRKRIKYIHLVTNCLIYHNVYQLTEVLKQLEAEGHEIPTEALPFINPYMTGHINRLGKYVLNLERSVPDADYVYKPGGALERATQPSSALEQERKNG